jgi:hypothetical protein
MKKLIAALTLLLAFSINATAQEKKATNSHDLAKKEATDLAAAVGLTETQTADFVRLFELKHTTLENKTLSDERKKVLATSIEAKIRATLDATQTDKLEKNKALFDRLIH